MTKDEARKEVTSIIFDVSNGHDRYNYKYKYCNHNYIRWGTLEKALFDVIDSIEHDLVMGDTKDSR